MGSTMKFQAHQANILARLAGAWEKRPDLSLGELLVSALDEASINPTSVLQRLMRSDDRTLVEAVEEYAMKVHSGSSKPPASNKEGQGG